MKHYGLIGHPLSHSFSKEYFNNKFAKLGIQATYHLIDLPSLKGIREILERLQLSGCNVTIPFKEDIIQYLDEVDEIALNIGAVNCIQIKKNVYKGFNTDVIGFESSFLPAIKKPFHQHRALIFGTGGAAKAVQYVLLKHQIPFTFVSRNETKDAITYADLTPHIMQSHQLLIHCTPLGTFPNIDAMIPVPIQYIGSSHVVFDMVYNPTYSKLLTMAKLQGAKIINGLDMLHVQAEESWKIFNQ